MQHRLSNLDKENRLADCSVCGPGAQACSADAAKKYWRCVTVRNRTGGYRAHYEHPLKRDRVLMLEEHGPCCDICGAVADGNLSCGVLHYDHNHETGKFRGWLCPECNKGLGKFKDDPKLLRAAAFYLEGGESHPD